MKIFCVYDSNVKCNVHSVFVYLRNSKISFSSITVILLLRQRATNEFENVVDMVYGSTCRKEKKRILCIACTKQITEKVFSTFLYNIDSK